MAKAATILTQPKERTGEPVMMTESALKGLSREEQRNLYLRSRLMHLYHRAGKQPGLATRYEQSCADIARVLRFPPDTLKELNEIADGELIEHTFLQARLE